GQARGVVPEDAPDHRRRPRLFLESRAVRAKAIPVAGARAAHDFAGDLHAASLPDHRPLADRVGFVFVLQPLEDVEDAPSWAPVPLRARGFNDRVRVLDPFIAEHRPVIELAAEAIESPDDDGIDLAPLDRPPEPGHPGPLIEVEAQ